MKPYDLTTHDGKKVDVITHLALLECERRLGYELTITQGSYNPGGVSASGGTHDGGGAVDLAPFEADRKVRIARRVGFAAWHRQAIPGLWPEHVHMVLIGNKKMSAAAAAQVVDYNHHRNGLADHAFDPTPHPDPQPIFHMPRRPLKRTRVLVVNAKSGSNPTPAKFVSWIAIRRRWRPVFVSEAKRIDLSPAGFVSQSHEGTKGHQENAVVTRMCPLSVNFIKLTDDLGTPMDPDRWATRTVMPGKHVDYAVHANAVIQDKETGRLKKTRGAKEWATVGLPILCEAIEADIADGYAVIVGGDMNWRGDDPSVPGSPAEAFTALGMTYVNAELLGVAFTPEWKLGRKLPILGPPVKRLPNPPGSDHAALSVRLVHRRRSN